VATVAVAWLMLAGGASAHIYWTESHSIGRANLDGSHAIDAFFPFQSAYAVAANDTHVFWAGVLGGDAIGRADLDGSNVMPNFITGANGVFQMASDAQHIYWTNGYANTIGRANVDGTGVNQSFIAANAPSGITVDAGHVYWSSGSTIGRANLDGTGVNQGFLAISGGGVGAGRIAADGNHIYWINMGTGAIGRADADGTNINSNFIGGPISYGITVDNQHIYWTLGSSIGRANLDGTDIRRAFITTADQVGGVAVSALTSAATTTEVTPSAPNTFYGDLGLTFTAAVTSPPGTPTPKGTVQFRVNGVDDGPPVALDAQGHAVYASSFYLDVGDTVTAVYSGDVVHDPSTSGPVNPQIQPAHTATALTTSANPLTGGDEVTLTATVTNTSTGVVPFGSVQFIVAGETVLQLPLDDNGEAGIVGGADLGAGDWLVQAIYRDDTGPTPDFTESQASLTQRVLGPPAPPIIPRPLVVTPPAAPPFRPATPNNRFSLIRATVGRGGVLTLLERAPEAGAFRATARTRSAIRARAAATAATLYGRAAASAAAPGRVRLVIKPTARARRALAHGTTLRLRLSVTFRPRRGGPPRTTTTAITVKGRRAPARH
jgi:hypothetical protein